jgi:hypothetical protein
MNAAKEKSLSPLSLTSARVLLLLVVTLFLPQTRVWGFAAPPQPASGQIASASTSAVVGNYDAWLYDASDSLAAADSEDETPDLSQCDRTRIPSNGRTGRVGHDDLKKWQNATNTAVVLV